MTRLRGRLAVTRLPVRSRRLDELFGALLGCSPAEEDQVAAMVASVVGTLTNPQRRRAMWKKMETIPAAEWRKLAAQKAHDVTRKTKRHETSRELVRELPSGQTEAIATALLGVVAHAVQGAGHFQLELDRAVQEGLVSETSAAWDLLVRLRKALRIAERKHVDTVSALSHMSGQMLALVTEHPGRIPELAGACEKVLPGQLRVLSLRLREERDAEAMQAEDVIATLGLRVERSEDLTGIAELLTRREAVGWGDEERRTATRIQLHLRQGEELPDSDHSGERRQRSMRQAKARKRASELLALLLVTRKKTPVWWERVVQASLKEIELDSLGAKRIKASRQRALAAKALESVADIDPESSNDRCMEAEIAAELGRSLGQLEFELSQRPGDAALEKRIAQTRKLREHFLAKQREGVRAKLAEGARELAAEGDLSTESGEWFFDMT